MFKKKILIDLDGVLNQYEKFDENFIPPIKAGAREFLEQLINDETELYLFTTRNLLLASKWLVENNLDKYFKDVTNVKIPAYLYIDDRCIRFDGNYNKTIKEIENFKVYWKLTQ
ncbi:hypothetical protein IJI31_03485 [bacterium]|nr:hypothetical protein [bacterium]